MAPLARLDRHTLAVLLAFAAVYFIWGSTYLAIRVAVETMPPFLMAAVRFGVSGVLLYVWCRRRGIPAPTRSQWRATAIVGTLLLLGGNGLVTWAEQWVPSGLAALLVASMPLWMGLMAWVVEPAARPSRRSVAGLVLGFGGVALLVKPGGDIAADPQVLVGGLAVLLASALWAAGSLYSRRSDVPPNPFLSTAMQMICGGLALTIAGSLSGEWSRLDPASISTEAWIALAYLISFGSIVAFSAYVWLLRASSPAKVSTYAFVNPVVAVALGWALLGEVVSGTTIVAAAVIVAAVALITTVRSPRSVASPGPIPPNTTPLSPDARPTRRSRESPRQTPAPAGCPPPESIPEPPG